MVKRINITLPEETAKKIESIPNKSKFIAEAIEDKIKAIEKAQLDELLEEGYKATKEEDNKLNKEWERITLDGW